MLKSELENLVQEQKEKIKMLEEENQNVKSLESRIKDLETEKGYLAKAVDEKDKKIWELKQNAEDFANKKLESIKKNFENTQKNYQEVIKKQEEQIKKLSNYINVLLNTHGSLLKTLQGTIDNAISLNDYIYNDIVRKENN